MVGDFCEQGVIFCLGVLMYLVDVGVGVGLVEQVVQDFFGMEKLGFYCFEWNIEFGVDFFVVYFFKVVQFDYQVVFLVEVAEQFLYQVQVLIVDDFLFWVQGVGWDVVGVIVVVVVVYWFVDGKDLQVFVVNVINIIINGNMEQLGVECVVGYVVGEFGKSFFEGFNC